MQAIDGACIDKAGHRARATFDKDFLHAARMERLHDPVGINEACTIRDSEAAMVFWMSGPVRCQPKKPVAKYRFRRPRPLP